MIDKSDLDKSLMNMDIPVFKNRAHEAELQEKLLRELHAPPARVSVRRWVYGRPLLVFAAIVTLVLGTLFFKRYILPGGTNLPDEPRLTGSRPVNELPVDQLIATTSGERLILELGGGSELFLDGGSGIKRVALAADNTPETLAFMLLSGQVECKLKGVASSPGLQISTETVRITASAIGGLVHFIARVLPERNVQLQVLEGEIRFSKVLVASPAPEASVGTATLQAIGAIMDAHTDIPLGAGQTISVEYSQVKQLQQDLDRLLEDVPPSPQ